MKKKNNKKKGNRELHISNKGIFSKVSLDDKFTSSCLNCNGCCKYKEDVKLSAYDVFRISKNMRMSIKEFLDKYCLRGPGYESSVPVVALKLADTDRCSLLKDGKCLSSEARPEVCAMYPLGRYTEVEEDGSRKIGFILVKESRCKKPSVYTVGEWLDLNGVRTDNKIYNIWSEMLHHSTLIMRIAKRKNQASTTILMYNMLWSYLYLSYDTNGDFIEQLSNNAKSIQELLISLAEAEGLNPKSLYSIYFDPLKGN